MIKNWLLEKIRDQALTSAERDVRQFVAGLERMEPRDLGALVAIATAVRVNMETYQVIPEGLFADDRLPSAEELGIYQMRINKVERQFRRSRKPADSAAALIWSYSLRCFNVAELRPLGRAMWRRLSDGFPHVEVALEMGEVERKEPFPERVWQEWKLIPVGLEPQ